jgi:tRNA dimethylallyltransferase
LTGQVIFIMGPTASGKTDLAMRLADKFSVDIISVDSAMIYKGMDVGTATPSAEELEAYPHALVSIKDPSEPYSAAEFCSDAKALIKKSFAHHRTPVLVGGTMLYFKALRDGLATIPEVDSTWREHFKAEAEQKGWPALHERLTGVDPVAAAKIKPQDAQRISRALEVFESTGKPLSYYWSTGHTPLEHPLVQVGLMPGDRPGLHASIARRFDQMLENGFMDEVKALHARGDLHADLPSIRSVGYRQAWAFLSGETDEKTMRDKAIIATRQLAKRQITWLRSFDGVALIDPSSEKAWQQVCTLVDSPSL